MLHMEDRLSNVLTAISHPSRRAILGRLAKEGPTRFTDVAEPFQVTLNAITKHVKLLERAGLVRRERQGREVLLYFRPEPLRLIRDWVHPYEQYWSGKLDEFEAYFRAKKKTKS